MARKSRLRPLLQVDTSVSLYSFIQLHISTKRDAVRTSAKKRALYKPYGTRDGMLSTVELARMFIEFPQCPSCGNPFLYGSYSNKQPMQLASVDRINANRRYTQTNVQILCLGCNLDKQCQTRAYRPWSQKHEAADSLWFPELTWDLVLDEPRIAERRPDTFIPRNKDGRKKC